MRILVIEDEARILAFVARGLEAEGFSVVGATDGAEGLRLANDVPCDLVLLDCNMPGIDGFETLAQIRQIAPRVDVVMMTATEDEAMAGRARASGAAAFIKKPFYPADIDAVITRIYGGSN